MQDTLRTRMGWLHAWIGFISGLLLFCVFATGSLAVFDKELTRWLQPEIPPQTHPFSPASLDHTLPTIRALLLQQEKPFLSLPSSRDPYLRVQYHDGNEFLTFPFDPQTGAPLPARATAGGTFFYDLHYTMRTGLFGETLIALAGLALLITLGSGIIIHLRGLLPDLVLLRPFAARLRAWLDVHVLTSVPFLPFIIVMAYTGTFIRARTVFPPNSYVSIFTAPSVTPSPTPPAPAPELPSLPPLLKQAEQTLGQGQTGEILFLPQSILFAKTDMSGPLLTREHVDFSPIDGHFLRHVLLPSPITHTQQMMEGIHYARWTNYTLRWLYFLSGIAGAVMFGSGCIIFLMKRRKQFSHKPIFRLAEGLAIGCLSGFPIATLGFFWANRLLPTTLTDRPYTEVHSFFIIWGISLVLSLIFCLFNHSQKVWKLSLLTLAMLSIALTPLDFFTRPHSTALNGANVFIITDLCALILGLSSAQIARRL